MRGVSSNHIIRKLVAKGLVKEARENRKCQEDPTHIAQRVNFQIVCLSSLSELPELDSEKENEQESELFTSIYKEETDEMGIQS